MRMGIGLQAFLVCTVFHPCLLPAGLGQETNGSPAASSSAVATAASPAEVHEGRWVREIEADLVAEKFDDLDQMADAYRREKTRLPGGDWRLRTFYEALDAPQLTDADSVAHVGHLERWVTGRPESITARIALATSLDRWAWVARGNGETNTVTPEGWRLFHERSGRAGQVLAGAANMKTMDPQFYAEWMTVGRAQEWNPKRVRESFERGVQFEPDYFYLYKEYASYLLPKWFGKPGESAAFAKQSADRVGGSAGDQLYFRIAATLIKRGDGDFPVAEMDWARIQAGYDSVAASYGSTHRLKNELAFMAWRYGDRGVASQQFAAIGPDWSRSVWRNREFFDRIRDWANGHNG